MTTGKLLKYALVSEMYGCSQTMEKNEKYWNGLVKIFCIDLEESCANIMNFPGMYICKNEYGRIHKDSVDRFKNEVFDNDHR